MDLQPDNFDNPYISQFTGGIGLLDEPQVDSEMLRQDLELYERGRRLRVIYNTPVWDILIDTLKAYVDGTLDQLGKLPPGDPTVPTAHAAWSALNQVYTNFQNDVQNAVDLAAHPPQHVTDFLSGALESQDVLKAMGVK